MNYELHFRIAYLYNKLILKAKKNLTWRLFLLLSACMLNSSAFKRQKKQITHRKSRKYSSFTVDMKKTQKKISCRILIPNVSREIRKIVELELLSLENPGSSRSTFRFIGQSFLVTDKKTSYVFPKNLREIFLRFSIAGCFNVFFLLQFSS